MYKLTGKDPVHLFTSNKEINITKLLQLKYTETKFHMEIHASCISSTKCYGL